MIPYHPSHPPLVAGRHPRRPRQLVPLGLMVALIAAAAVATATNMDTLLASLRQLGGTEATFRDWQKLLNDTKPLGAMDKLKRVNEFFNRRIQFGDDQHIWGQSDYWATPLETLAKGKGDCEDFTIAKYFTLRNAGVPVEQLRLVYVKAKIGGAASTVTQAHMVLAYYATPDAEPVVLDNLITDLRPASRRPDLAPVFSFNSQGIWQGAGGGDVKGPSAAVGSGRLSRWEDLLKRAHAEGFD